MTDKRVYRFSSLYELKPKVTINTLPSLRLPKRYLKIPNFLLVRPKSPCRPNMRDSTTHVNIKVTMACKQSFYQMAESLGIKVIGDLIEKALDAHEAIERLEGSKRP